MGNDNFDAVIDSMIEESTEPDTPVADDSAATQTEPTQDAPQSDDTGATTPTEEPKTDDGKPTTVTPQSFKVKFRHEEKELSLEEMTALAQKGMLYDAEDMGSSLSSLREIAKANGYGNVREYLDAVKQANLSNQAQQLAQDKSIPQEIAQEYVADKQKIADYERADNERRAKEEQTRKTIAEINDFQQKYPGVDVKNLPQEVLLSKSKNPEVPLSFHYAAYREQILKQEAAVQKKQEENKASATPSLRDNSSDSFNEEDALLKEVFED